MILYVKDIEAHQGMTVETFRHEQATLLSWTLTGQGSKGGRVYIEFEGGERGEYFPSVIGGAFRDTEDDRAG